MCTVRRWQNELPFSSIFACFTWWWRAVCQARCYSTFYCESIQFSFAVHRLCVLVVFSVGFFMARWKMVDAEPFVKTFFGMHRTYAHCTLHNTQGKCTGTHMHSTQHIICTYLPLAFICSRVCSTLHSMYLIRFGAHGWQSVVLRSGILCKWAKFYVSAVCSGNILRMRIKHFSRSKVDGAKAYQA